MGDIFFELRIFLLDITHKTGAARGSKNASLLQFRRFLIRDLIAAKSDFGNTAEAKSFQTRYDLPIK